MADQPIENRRFDGATFHRCCLERVRFDDVNLKSAVFHNVNLSKARFEDVNLSDSRIDNANLRNVRIDHANVEGLTIYGYDIHALLQPLMARDAQQKDGSNS